MIDKLTIYSKPTNIHNIQGRFYNVYLNKNTNLDLTSLNQQTFNTIKDQGQTTISEEIYDRLLLLLTSQRDLLETIKRHLNTISTNFQDLDTKIYITNNEGQQLLQNLQENTNRRGAR